MRAEAEGTEKRKSKVRKAVGRVEKRTSKKLKLVRSRALPQS